MGLRNLLQRLFTDNPPPATPRSRGGRETGSAALSYASGGEKDIPATLPPRDPLSEVTSVPLAEGVRMAMVLLARETSRAGALTLLRWLREVSSGAALQASLRLEVADFFAARAEPETASRVLLSLAEGPVAEAPPAMVVLGDLALRQGDATSAARWYESVLAIDLGYPGARERLARLRQPTRAGEAGATLLAPDARAGLGRFELVKELGRGSAGAVFQARDKRLERAVALKLYHPQSRADRHARLRGEAQIAAAVASPFVVRVYDLFDDVGGLAMEYASGQSLRQRVARGGFAPAVARRWLYDLARALARTHERGWVHRDVKPGNVLLRRDGRAVLTDYGLARREGAPAPAREGTPGYMAPEADAGGTAWPGLDVYAFGALGRDLLGPTDPIVGEILSHSLETDPARRPTDGNALRSLFEQALGLG